MMSPSSPLNSGYRPPGGEKTQQPMSSSEKQGENRTGTGDGGILALLFVSASDLCTFPPCCHGFFRYMFSPAVSFLFLARGWS